MNTPKIIKLIQNPKFILGLALFLIIVGFRIKSIDFVYGAPIQSIQRNIVPETDSKYYLGTTTPTTKAWLGIITDELCLNTSCKTAWPSGGGGSHWATTSPTTSSNGIYPSRGANVDVLIGAISTTSKNKLEVIGNGYFSGLVGIGTTSPYAKLSVVGSSGIVAAKFHATSTTATSTFNGGLTTGTSGLNVLVGGRVGIGTIAPASSLQIGSGQILIPNGSVTAPSLAFGNKTDTGWYLGFGTRPSLAWDGTNIYEYTGTHIFSGGINADSFSFSGLSASPFVQFNTPQTGFNFTGRGSSTQNSGDIWIIAGTPSATSAGSKVRITGSVGSGTNQNGGDVYIDGGAPTGTGLYGNVLIGRLGGNVGIGTTSPIGKLHVSNGASATTTISWGEIGASGSKVCVNTKNNTGGGISFYFVGTTMVVENNLCK